MKRLLMVLVLAGLWVTAMPAPVPAQETPSKKADAAAPFDAAEQRQIEEIIRVYLTKNPEVIVEALTAYEVARREAEEAKAAALLAERRADLERDSRSPVAGNPQGDVTVVEFFDYRCGYCKRVLPAVQELLASDANVRYVFKEFPILGPQSLAGAKAAQAAWRIAPDRYLDFHVALMETRNNLTEDHILELAKGAGIDPEALKAAMNDPEIEATIGRNVELGRAIGVRGTPAFVINGQLLPGAIDLATMRRMVADARSG